MSSIFIPIRTKAIVLKIQPYIPTLDHFLKMPPQSTENKFKILIAGLSQSAKGENFLPTPNYYKLAEDLGLPSYASAQGVWKRLTDELKKGAGDLKIRNPEGSPKSPEKKKPVIEKSPKKRVVDESDGAVDNYDSSPTKRSKVNNAKRGSRKGSDKTGKEKVIKESEAEVVKFENEQFWSSPDEA